jgi:heme exporter protein B
LNRSFAIEKNNDALHGLLLAPLDRSAIYFGKLVAGLIFMFVVEVVSLPLFIVMFNYAPTGSWLLAAAVIVLATFGFLAIGTFLAALTANTKASEILLPVILFPVVIPVVIAAVEATRGIFSGAPTADFITWFKVLGVYDLVFVAVPFLLFEYLLEV